jgi:glycine hydroxymethyltransferase
MHVIAAKAVAFKEALSPTFKDYQRQVVANARAMAQVLLERGYKVVSGGTDNHLFLLDLIARNVTGKDAEEALGRAHITVNKNAVPNDPKSPFVTSGLRLGSPASTTRGFREPEMRQVATWIADLVDAMSAQADVDATILRIRDEVDALCARFPVYGGLRQAA